MRIRRVTGFDRAPRDAVSLQRRLAVRVRASGPAPRPLRLVAGVDCSLTPKGRLVAAAVVCASPAWEVVEEAWASAEPALPYVPGLLSFREAPVVLEALRRLASSPQVVLVDGQGLAHPRRLGLASHVGLFLDVPTIGVAKSIFVGRHARLGPKRGETSPLLHRGERIGMALRTRTRIKPVYVSVGDGIGLMPAVRTVLRTADRYRLPEPIRQADLRSRRRARAM